MEKKSKQNLWLATGLLFIAAFGLIPPPDGLSVLSMQVIGIFVGTVILWLKVAGDWPSLLCVAVLLLLGVVDSKSAFANLLGNPTCAFLVFSYMLAHGLVQTNLLRRCAVWFISRKIVRNRPWVLIIMLMTAAMLVGLVIIPSTMFLIFLPIAEQILRQCKVREGEPLGEVIILMMAFTGSIAQGMTPIGHAHPLIAMSILEQSTGTSVSYVQFMLFAIPVGIVCIVLMLLYFRYIVRPDVSVLAQADVEELRESLGPMTREEKLSMYIFIGVVLWWLAPSIVQPFWPAAGAILSGLGNVIPAMVGVLLMAIIRVNDKPLLTMKNAAKDVPWTIIFMVGATMILSGALTGDAAGISNWIGHHMSGFVGNLPMVFFVLLAVFWVVMQTNFSSNAVSATLVMSIMLPIVLAKPGYMDPSMLTVMMGSACCYAFATPLATAVIAIACGTNWASTQGAWKHGMVMVVMSVIVFVVIGMPVANLVF